MMHSRMRNSTSATVHRASPPVVARPLRLAAIDIGSNSVHMIIVQIEPDGAMVFLCRMKEMIGLAAVAFPRKMLPRDAIDRAVATVGRFKQTALARRCEKIRCVATSAVRESSNGGDLLQRISNKLNLTARIVSGREEARLIYLGVRHEAHLKSPTLIIDVGGGSVEFIVGNTQQASLLESRKIGASRMTAQFVQSDPLSAGDLAAIRSHYDRELTPVCEKILALHPTQAIGTSGTLETIALLCLHHTRKNNGEHRDTMMIERGPFQEVLAALIESDARERAQMPEVDPHRRDQIVAGALLVDQLFRRLKLRRIEICNSALREGILLDYVAKHVPELSIRQRIPDPRRRSVLALARRCAWHKSHSEQVARLCLAMFDQLRSLHGLGAPARELIEYGALLHDIGWHIAQKGHHKHSMYLINNGDLEGFSAEEIEIIANIARYHRKSPPKQKHTQYHGLSAKARRIVDVGAALLRLADGLDRSHTNAVEGLRCRLNSDQVTCSIQTPLDAQLEIWGANRKREMFESIFHRSIHFELARAQS